MSGSDSQVPAWLRQLVDAAGTITGAEMSRFLPPDDGSGRESAVLITLGDVAGQGPSVLLIERAADMRNHAGQVAFPGGSIDPDDAEAQRGLMRAKRMAGKR